MSEIYDSSDETIDTEDQRKLKKVCDEFEVAWKDKRQPQVEDFATRVDGIASQLAAEVLLAMEMELRNQSGEFVDVQDYIERYPQYEDQIRNAVKRFDAGSTRDRSGTQPDRDSESYPSKIGRYEIQKEIGAGGFGVVCLGLDQQLERLVALKFAKCNKFQTEKEIESFIREAKTAAQLDHAQIVSVYDVVQEQDFICIVQQFIDGSDLKEEFSHGSLRLKDKIKIIRYVADAIGYAHQKGFVHRDLKPANLLLDKKGVPHIADFGLAIHESAQRRQRGQRSGTPKYMSPELVRGETHRLDGRSDIWSVGVILYELLTGHKPFNGETRAEVFDEIKHREPKPPRQLDKHIPAELERICLKCLSKRISDRYAIASDLADDLGLWLEEHHEDHESDRSSSRRSIAVVPKGLRSFGANDSEFFLQLLPGPRDRDGYPEIIRFWKSQAEDDDLENPFQVGLIYGPSGCGKSSIVKAGLLPNLDRKVVSIYLEATPRDTESRLLNGIAHRFHVDEAASLADILAELRRANREGGRKLLIVIDQFEQWLHHQSNIQEADLTQALRQCDGHNVQCILLVRDDFWLATNRFFQALEIDVLEGQNATLVDLFDLQHARKVLTAFGQAFDAVPEAAGNLSREQNDFLELAVNELAENGRVISVRLALFAEMVKNHAWTPATLKRMGGTEGVGVRFLEETFGKNGRPDHRLYEKPARAILAALLPGSGTNIRGQMQPYEELMRVAGLEEKREDFGKVMRVLDKDLRLISTTDPEGVDDNSMESSQDIGESYFQLTHDFLVGSIRRWLTKKQKETRSGRALLRLSERNATWAANPNSRYLPSGLEYLNIRMLTSSTSWSESESRMMKSAGRFHGIRFLGIVAVVILAAFLIREVTNRVHANNLVNRLLEANITDVPEVVEGMDGYRRWVDPKLDSMRNQWEDLTENRRLKISLASANKPESQNHVLSRIATADPSTIATIINLMEPHKEALVDPMWTSLESPTNTDSGTQLRYAAVLAHWQPDNRRWNSIGQQIAELLVSQFDAARWTELVRPVSGILIESMVKLPLDDRQRILNTVGIFKSFINDNPSTVSLLEAELAEASPLDEMSDEDFVAICKRQADICCLLLALDAGEMAWPHFDAFPEPTTRSFIIENLNSFVDTPDSILKRLAIETNPSIRSGLILSLAKYDQNSWEEQVKGIHRNDLESGPHFAADWLLREKGIPLPSTDGIESLNKYENGRTWREGPIGLKMVRFDAPGQFEMTFNRPVTIDWDFEFSTTQITVEQYCQCYPDSEFTVSDRRYTDDSELSGKTPAKSTWYSAAGFCNWLSEQSGIPKDQWVYIPYQGPTIAPNVDRRYMVAENYLERSGFRLPFEAEWEIASAAAHLTHWHCGRADEVLKNYEWYVGSIQQNYRPRPAATKKPNVFGISDVHGNVADWCNDEFFTEDAGPLPDIFQAFQTRNLSIGHRVIKGESYFNIPKDLQIEDSRERGAISGALSESTGFRVVRRIR